MKKGFRRDGFQLCRICNPTPLNMSICDAKKGKDSVSRITNPNIQWSRIANPAQPYLRKTHTQQIMLNPTCAKRIVCYSTPLKTTLTIQTFALRKVHFLVFPCCRTALL